jgi:cardiolipin synthase
MVGARGPLSRRQSNAILSRLAAQAPNAGALERHLAVEQAVAESPLFTGNSVRILRDGEQTFPAMFAAIRGARHSILLEYYIFEDVSCDGEQLGDLLVAKAQAGVQVDLIYDGIGSIGTPSDFFARLQAAGVKIVQFNPPNPLNAGGHFSINDRDHRKMLIADDSLVIVGGVNLSSTYQSAPGASQDRTPAAGHQEVWHDTDLQISGPVVGELKRLFSEHWREQQGPTLGGEGSGTTPAPAGNDQQGNPAGSEVVRIIGSAPKHLTSRYYVTLLSAIRNAESSIWITSAYFVPTHQEKQGLIHAARSGVDVRLLLPSHSDSSPALQVQHSHYTDLLGAGVKIFERDDGILHSKTMVVDGVWSMTGSSNFDHRSVLFNDEVDAVVLGKETGGQLAAAFQSDVEHAKVVDLASWRQRGQLTKLREQFWKLWEKLL